MERTIGRLLLAAVRRDQQGVATNLRQVDKTRGFAQHLADAASYHAVVPLLAEALAEAGAPHRLRDPVSSIHRAHTSHVLRLEANLLAAVKILASAGIRSVCFKGPALAHGYYEVPSQRTYSDIDLLVTSSDLGAASEALGAAGFRLNSADWRETLAAGYGELLFLGPNGTALDLHWHVMREPAIRRAFNLETRDLLDRSEVLKIEGSDVAVLDPVDTLITVATHACYDGAYRLGWLVDIARIERSGRIRWGVLADRCATTGVALPVQVLLDRSRRSIPPGDPHTLLAHSGWRSLMKAVATIRSVEYTFGQVARGGILYRATRRTTTESLAAVTGLIVHEVAGPVRIDSQHRWRRKRHDRDRPIDRK